MCVQHVWDIGSKENVQRPVRRSGGGGGRIKGGSEGCGGREDSPEESFLPCISDKEACVTF